MYKFYVEYLEFEYGYNQDPQISLPQGQMAFIVAETPDGKRLRSDGPNVCYDLTTNDAPTIVARLEQIAQEMNDDPDEQILDLWYEF